MNSNGRTPKIVPIDGLLDLHTFSPKDTKYVVNEYIHAAVDADLTEIRIIHGRGIGVQRGIVQATLETHPLVTSFTDAPESHLGATVVNLNRRPE